MRVPVKGIFNPSSPPCPGQASRRKWTYLKRAVTTDRRLLLTPTVSTPLDASCLDASRTVGGAKALNNYRSLGHDVFLPVSRYSSEGQPSAGITLLSGVSDSTMCPFQATPQVTVHSKREAEPSPAGRNTYPASARTRSRLCLFPSCRTATPCGEDYLTPYSCLLDA